MKLIECVRRAPAPGGASPRGPLLLRVEGEFSAEFRVQAGRVLARRNREVLADAGVAQMVPGAGKRLRRVGQRQGIQIALLMKGGAR